ncbi:hypothetical protein NCG97_19775 [Streptomyces lydicamycinicus]|uniref:Uncharacterized protein n=1 Tax=Streptomyces lydicamycinicus TaxID=1546107 RepID=A0A0N7YKZ9_9ACTN|nr:hypothetical protein [Streptomyces lydicamycinicus]USA02402.1 hypothetical protein NCG97_19775 [Streptomyces lydicamycinicus]GAO07419.1 hypothetical protein TPA0598_02_06580 [Streptomyces lydicamycinicus]
MTLTVEDAIHQAMETWRRLGIEQDATDEMAEELAADLTAAAFDGRSVTDYIGGDVDALAASWAVERGLLPTRPNLKETATAAARGAAIPAVAAIILWCAGTPGGLLDRDSEAMTTQLHGPPVWEVHHYPNPGTPLMWVGWAVCLVAAFFLIRRAVAARLQRRHDPAREETTRALTKALPFILLAAALLGTAINFLGEYAFPYFQAIVTILVAPVAMIGAVAAAAAWVRDRACPPLNSSRVKYRLPAA